MWQSVKSVFRAASDLRAYQVNVVKKTWNVWDMLSKDLYSSLKSVYLKQHVMVDAHTITHRNLGP